MDSDRVAGKGKQIKGKVREEVGKVAGSDKQVIKGKSEQGEGKAQEFVGKAKDKIRDITK